MATYYGFSTQQNVKNYTLTDFQLAQQDLMNYFSIRKGQKLMQPNFGSVIWTTLFEPLDETTQQTITTDVQQIVGYDPRLRADNISVTQQTNGFLISISLTFIPTNQTQQLMLTFDRNTQTLTTG